MPKLIESAVTRLAGLPGLAGAIEPHILRMALAGYYRLRSEGRLEREGIITVIDFNRPSVDKRLFVIDLDAGRILHSDFVAHGKASGETYARSFSNRPGSHQSSLGFYTTGETYQGAHGYSMRLNGEEQGVNDNAAMRAIVMHPAGYVSSDFISKYGRLGRSQGCPALPEESSREVIDLIKGGSCLFIYHDSRNYSASNAQAETDAGEDRSRSS